MQRRTIGVLAAFVAVYLIWGSTYLGIRFAIETMPPFLMASARWLAAGGLLYAWRRFAGDAAPTAREWLSASIVGVALILGGNGLVSWAQQWVPSGLTALLIAIVPLWIAVLLWSKTGMRPAPRVAAGILLGLAGVAVLSAPAIIGGFRGATATLFGTLAILAATLSWASGSIYSRGAKLPKSTLLAVAMEMLAGGIALGIVGLATGESARVDLAGISARSWIAFGFLAIFGSIVAFSAYIWLLREVRPELVATYAFVNPVVAVILGTLVAGETLTARTIAAAALIVVGVALVVTGGWKAPARAAAAPAPDPRD